uniref:K Homology domain-containing protein n=1 Tax=Chromera velia CCMP2878 TaxID=1169474 RepID=A0A0G4F5F1_9ALVE|eukprot:Cvel_15315.t1-p1 / transcript=Cvel_15315.t1 / gene=Cvel_15315 / organism=Chromera_velia_CCMP2878 / gene_product=hypothetical protein / transcript_product=hypothetical protein / location=Cvel_scaffold1126:5666-11672(-) / protein_length=727 / sequence_SO=supercontig / SO=protein_coding / is_pseudo=false
MEGTARSWAPPTAVNAGLPAAVPPAALSGSFNGRVGHANLVEHREALHPHAYPVAPAPHSAAVTGADRLFCAVALVVWSGDHVQTIERMCQSHSLTCKVGGFESLPHAYVVVVEGFRASVLSVLRSCLSSEVPLDFLIPSIVASLLQQCSHAALVESVTKASLLFSQQNLRDSRVGTPRTTLSIRGDKRAKMEACQSLVCLLPPTTPTASETQTNRDREYAMSLALSRQAAAHETSDEGPHAPHHTHMPAYPPTHIPSASPSLSRSGERTDNTRASSSSYSSVTMSNGNRNVSYSSHHAAYSQSSPIHGGGGGGDPSDTPPYDSPHIPKSLPPQRLPGTVGGRGGGGGPLGDHPHYPHPPPQYSHPHAASSSSPSGSSGWDNRRERERERDREYPPAAAAAAFAFRSSPHIPSTAASRTVGGYSVRPLSGRGSESSPAAGGRGQEERERESKHTHSVLVPAHRRPRLSGNNGGCLRDLGEFSGATFCFGDGSDDRGFKEVLVSAGDLASCDLGVKVLRNKLSTWDALETNGPVKKQVAIPDELVSMLIGAGGKKVAELQLLSGAVVSVGDPSTRFERDIPIPEGNPVGRAEDGGPLPGGDTDGLSLRLHPNEEAEAAGDGYGFPPVNPPASASGSGSASASTAGSGDRGDEGSVASEGRAGGGSAAGEGPRDCTAASASASAAVRVRRQRVLFRLLSLIGTETATAEALSLVEDKIARLSPGSQILK